MACDWELVTNELTDQQQHPIYYSGPHIVLKVEETLFRIQPSLLCKFDTFRDMFQDATAHLKDNHEGLTDDNPITLNGIAAFEMESLLHVIQARYFIEAPSVSLDQWKAVLHLSTMWEHEKLRQLSINKIDSLKLPPLESLGLATKCRVEKWIKPAAVGLCLRPWSLSFEEGERLGFHFFAGLCNIRECCLSMQFPGAKCQRCGRIYASCSTCGSGRPPDTAHNLFRSSMLDSGSKRRCSGCAVLPPTPSLEEMREEEASKRVDSLLAAGIRPLPEKACTTNLDITGHHPTFYEGDCITYQLEQTLFRVRKVDLWHFQRLRDIFDSVVLSEGTPLVIKLSGVTELEMASTLDILEARWFDGTPSINLENWKAALQVATLWDYPALRQLAIEQIEKLKPTPMESILLA
ncbi:hypothetical protein FRC02_007573, partial [Tulasnella sp. 418]